MDQCEISSEKRRPLLLFLGFCIVLYQINSIAGNVRCTFNVCSFSRRMCANGGTCKMNEECLPECDCPTDFSGRRCEIINNNHSCPDACSLETCNQVGSCSQDPDTCNISCSCFDGFYGDTCDLFDSGYESQCFPLVCVHGHCNNSRANQVSCICDDQWIGDTCNIPCRRNCTQGECIIFQGNETCLCPDLFTAESNCTEESEEIRSYPIEDAGLPLPFLLFLIIFPAILLLVFVLIVFVMWKKRMIFVMKIVYHLQKYEDSDGKLYDAFISFRSSRSDEYWVLNTLFPKLENEMGFKICVHYRDFVAGETISNNIIDAIEKSRRTIIVVSPDYVSGEWTRMEYQVAQQEMLSLRHKIIPIMYRDIGSMHQVDKNLKLILNTVTYIKWPTDLKQKDIDKFWEQLRLIMPKKHQVKSILKGGDVINEWTADTRL